MNIASETVPGHFLAALDDAERVHRLTEGMNALDVMPRVKTWPRWQRETFLRVHKGHSLRWALFVFFVGNGVEPSLAVELIEVEDFDKTKANPRVPGSGFIHSRDSRETHWKKRMVSDWKSGKQYENPRSAAFPSYQFEVNGYWPIVYQKQRGGPFFKKEKEGDGVWDRVWKERE